MFNFKNKTPVFGLGTALFVLIAIGINSYQSFTELNISQKNIKRGFEVSALLDETLLLLTQSETGQRGYLLTTDPAYLKIYEKSVNLVNPTLDKASQLSLNQQQKERIETLKPLIKEKLFELAQTIDIDKNKGLPQALEIVNTNKGKILMDKIQGITAEIKIAQNDIIRHRSATSDSLAANTSKLLLGCILLSVVLVAWAVYALNQEIDAQKKLQADLKLLNDELELRVKLRTQELESVNRSKDEFLSVLSHELRTPLTAILGWTKLLYSEETTSTTAKNALEIIERNANAQAQLIEDILDISRIIQGKFKLTVRSLDFASLVELAIDSIKLAANARQIRIESILDTTNSTINGDSDRLQSVVWNLLSNAIKFTPKGGKIKVRLQKIDSSIQLTVADNGIGINPEFLSYVFDRFRQEDGAYNRAHGGLGLGLAIAKQIVEMHGGTVAADSPGEGLGATFTVTLPIAIASFLSTGNEKTHYDLPSTIPFKSSSALAGLTVLIVDDHVDARTILKAILEKSGARVLEAGSARGAIVVLNNSNPDILVSDIGMPYEDGYELIRQVRNSEKWSHIPAIAVTAYARDEDRIRALDEGFQMHISKPVEPAYLVAVVAKVGRGI